MYTTSAEPAKKERGGQRERKLNSCGEREREREREGGRERGGKRETERDREGERERVFAVSNSVNRHIYIYTSACLFL